MSAADTLM